MLTYIELKNFRSHGKTRIEFSPGVTDLFGPFGSGKTSIVHAVCTCLTGRNPYIDGKGAGMNDDISAGASGYELSLEINGLKVRRSKTKTGHSLVVEGAPADLKGAQAVLLSKLGFASADPITALLDTVLFSNRPEAEQKLLLLKLLGSPKIEVTAGLRRVGITEVTGAEHIAKLEKDIKEQAIRGRNRELDGLNPPELQAAPKRTALTIEAELKILRHEMKSDREKRLAKAGSEVERLSIALAQLDNSRYSARAAKDKAASDYTLFESRLSEDSKRERIRLEQAVETAKSIPVAWNELDCPTDGCGMNAILRKRGQEAEKDKDDRIAKAEAALKAFSGKPSPEQKRKLAELAKDLSDAAAKVDGFQAQIAEASAALEDAKVVLDEESRQCDLDAEATGQQIAALERERAAAEAYASVEAVRERRAKRAAVLNDEIGLYRKALSDLEAIRQSILDEGLEPFLKGLKAVMASVGLKPPKVSMDPFEFTVGGYAISHLSDGEKVVLDLALRLAAAKRLKFPVVAVDNLTLLDRESRAKLIEAGARAGLQFIACETEQSWTEKAMDGARTYRLEDGVATEVQAAAA